MHGQWTAEEVLKSLTWWELSTVNLILLSVVRKRVNAHLHSFTHNQNVLQLLQVSSTKHDLHVHETVLRVLSIAVQYHIGLEPKWVHVEFNERNDFLSRTIDYNDWYLNPAVFAWLDSIMGHSCK